MRSRYKFVESDAIYFVTATIVEWIPVFTCPDSCRIVIDALKYAREHKGMRLYAYVIMDNHLHLVAEAPELSRVLQEFKSHTAREILTWAKRSKRDWLVNQFAYYRKRHKLDSRYQVWQEGSHPQMIQSREMLEQKITYIHANPVRRGWVEVPEHWRYSSARNMMLEDDSVLAIDWLGE